jgi:hypothetical protein
MKLQTSNNKPQNNLKIPTSKFLGFGSWRLGFIWKLDVWILIFFFLTFLVSQVFAQLDFNGYYENSPVVLAKRDGDILWGDLNRLRLRLGYEATPNIYFRLEPEYNFFIKSEEIPLLNVSDVDKLVFDRAYVKFYLPLADVTAGRQRIAWGAGYIWNPTDAFNPFSLAFAVEEEQEAEPEAVRVEIPLGELSGIDTYVVTNQKWEEAKKGLRARTNLGLYDFSLSYVDRGSGSYQIGFDSTGELFELGVRTEIASIFPSGADSYLQAILGWNYTFENGWGMDMEYYYNGLGQGDKDDYDWIGLYSGNINQLGRDYAYFSLNKLLDEINNVRFSLITNLNDLSFIFYPAYSRNIFQNVDLSLEALLMGGDEGSEYSPGDFLDPTGFIGSDAVLVRVRWGF